MLGRLRRRAARLPGLQPQPGVDLHGRLRLAVHRLLPGQHRAARAARRRRAVAQLPGGARRAGAGAVHPDLRHDASSRVMRKLAGRAGVAGRPRSHVASAGRARPDRAARGLDALRASRSAPGVLALLVRDMRRSTSAWRRSPAFIDRPDVPRHPPRRACRSTTRRRWPRRASKPLVAFLVDLSYKRRIFEVLLDVVLISLRVLPRLRAASSDRSASRERLAAVPPDAAGA